MSNENTSMSQLFDTFQKSLDAHHDKRERLIKSVRTTLGGKDMEDAIAKQQDILALIRKVSNELNGPDYYRYIKSVSPGLEEFIEAAAFLEFIKNGSLLTPDKLQTQFAVAEIAETFFITDSDYLNGIGDLTGELMRYAINKIGAGEPESAILVCHFMQQIHEEFEVINAISPSAVSKKLQVMKASLTKVEQACYSCQIRKVEQSANSILPQKRVALSP
ncbi:hypothetical protein INT43_002524 [Umbelopsis isabellina]|uniref:Translin n=1 Tax=Mortierella isabellina TaxID=91625 RepID=A0A8H7Q5B2_MORIS|nr:hypothetical protein INT43_002524 [Umbelopsis isabellina]